MHDYCSFANHYFIIFSLTQSDSIPSSSLLFFFFISHALSSSAQPINHLPITTQQTQPPTTILQHIKIQSQIQQKIKAKINKNQQKSNLKSTPTYQMENLNPLEALYYHTLTEALSKPKPKPYPISPLSKPSPKPRHSSLATATFVVVSLLLFFFV